MSDDTSTIRIFDADPERVVSVTVGELRNLCKWAYGCGHDFVGMSDATIHEQTCHMVFIGRVGGLNQWRCDACGCRSSERIISDRLHDPSPAWCHRCGARVVDDGKEEGGSDD